MATSSKTLTYEEWLMLPEVEGVEEVVNGEIRKMPPNKVIHADIVENLADLLKAQLDRTAVRVRVSTFGLIIHLDPLSTRVPGIGVFIWANVVEREGYIHSAPELIVEVLSPANTRSERAEKLRDMKASGFPKSGWFRPKPKPSKSSV